VYLWCIPGFLRQPWTRAFDPLNRSRGTSPGAKVELALPSLSQILPLSFSRFCSALLPMRAWRFWSSRAR